MHPELDNTEGERETRVIGGILTLFRCFGAELRCITLAKVGWVEFFVGGEVSMHGSGVHKT